jgi:hypothetical protein
MIFLLLARMTHTLRYGTEQQLSLSNLPDTARILGLPALTPLTDCTARLAEMLAHPTNFPELQAALVPGDRIVLALGPGLSCRVELVAGVVQYLLDKGHAANEIAVLQTVADANLADPRGQLEPSIASQVELLTHYPGQREELGYLCADEQGNPIYFHRSLIEADFIIPIMSAEQHIEPLHGASGLHPLFSQLNEPATDAKKPKKSKPTTKRKPTANTDELLPETPDFLLGVMFGIRVIGGGPDELYALHVGQVDTIQQQSSQQLAQLWRTEIAGRFELVVLAIPHGEPLRWEKLTPIITRWLPHLRKNGMFVLATDLSEQLPASLNYWAQSGWRDDLLPVLAEEKIPGAELVHAFAAARKQARLYLLSNLHPDVVSDLGWSAVSNAQEVERLVHEAETQLIVHHADRC